MKIDLEIRGVKVTVEYDYQPSEPENGIEGGNFIESVFATGAKIDLTEWVDLDSKIESEILEGIETFSSWVMEPDYE